MRLSLNYHKVVTHNSPGLPAPGLHWEKFPHKKKSCRTHRVHGIMKGMEKCSAFSFSVSLT